MKIKLLKIHCKIGNWKLEIGLIVLLFFLLSNQANASTIAKPSNFLTLNTGLVGWWTFDGKDTPWTSATAATTLDKSGNYATGTLTNMNQATTPVAGKIGQGLKFNGTTQSVALPLISLGTVNSGSVWVTGVNNSNTIGNLIASNYFNDGGYLLSLSNGALYYLGESGGTPSYVSVDTGTLSSNQWYNLAVSRNGTSVTFYKNGIQLGTTQTLGNNYPVTINSIGAYGSGNGIYLNGSMDDIRVYNRALSAGEIRQLYNIGAATKVAATPKGIPSTGLNSGLVGWWTFDGPKMINNVTDSSGQGNNGYLKGQTSTTTVAGKIGQALQLDGVDDYVDTTLTGGDNYHPSLYFADQSPWTFSAWIYSPSSAPLQATENYAGAKLSSYSTIFRLNQYGNNVFGYYSQGYTPYNFQSDAAFYRKNVWFLMTWVADSSRNLTLYINGANPTTVAIDNSQTVFQQFGGASSFFNGRADDVRIYNRVLSAGEITQLYNLGAATKVAATPKGIPSTGLNSGLVGWWTFDGKDTINGVALDKSGNNNTGNLINIATSTFYAAGKIGQALNFDGVNDYVKVQVGAIPISPVTACAWVYPTAANSLAIRHIIGNVTDFDLYSYNSYWYVSGHTSQVASANPSIQVNVWQHVCGVNDASGNGTLYINGVLSSVPGSIGASQTSAWNTVIGARGTLVEEFFSGKIDDVRVYNRALSAGEITQLYNLGK